MGKRIFNFAAGPCTLPLPALEKAQSEFVDFQNNGMSLIEMSHRSKGYDEVHQGALANLRELLAVPETHDIMLLQGGATIQFAMIPMNLATEGKTAAYALTGSWAKKAVADAEKVTSSVKVVWSGEDENFTRMPKADELKVDDSAAYLHITSNETIGGIEYQEYPDADVPIVADMSSHVMSRSVPWDKISLGYGGAQKNLGPAGLTFAIMKKELIEKCNALPAYLSYKIHSSKGSLYNTPPVFGIYMMKLTTDWVKEVGGLAEMEKRAIKRSSLVYDAIDNSDGWYRCPMDKGSRSRMNVCFRLPEEELEKKFIAEALEKGMSGLKGHRSVGGCRASMYNAMPVEGAETLATFMADFKKKNS